MSHPVFSGQDVPDAVASAARSLGLEAARLRYVVLDPGRPGGLGVSASPARIAVLLERRPAGEARPVAVPRSHAPEDAQPPAPRTGDVRADIRSLVRVLGAPPRGPRRPLRPGRAPAIGCPPARLPCAAPAAAHLRARLISGRLTVECEGYRDHRDGRLRARALELVRAVEADGKPRRTEALNSYERRIVHMVVSEHPSLETYSVGEGADRRVTIAPRRAPEAGGGPAEPPRD
ncbi:MAG: hypothetical protein DMF77_14250 [Acidobacteria bacterium]|nr:MAG: hypothetical protein DMF77_14250 [Acidobacteriota bacterium]